MKKIFMQALVWSSLALLAVPLAAQDARLDAFLSEMEKAEEKVKDLRFSFVQDVSFAKTQEKQHFEGTVTFKKPNKLKIVYEKPLKQEIISDGKKIWIYTPQYNQAVEDSWSNWEKRGMLPQGLFTVSETIKDLKERYHVRLLESASEGTRLEFVPKQEEVKDTALKVLVSNTDHLPRATEFSSSHFLSKTTLQNVSANQGAPDSLFRFKAPKGTTVERFNR